MRTISHGSTRLMAVLVLALLVSLVGANALAAKGEVKLGYVLWDSEIASHNVAAAVLEEKMGYDVELVAVDAGPLWTGMARGDFDATLAAWLPATHKSYYEQLWADIELLGPNLHGAKIGLVVPSYVDIDSIEDLNDHRSDFRGRIVGIDPGAGIMEAADAALDDYDLNFDLQDGSDAAMTAELSRAIRRNEWVVITGWTPHWKFGEWDLKYLDDPKGTFGEAEYIATVASKGLQERLPEVYEFLSRFYWTNEDMAEVMIDIENGTPEREAAMKWIEANPDKVSAWIP